LGTKILLEHVPGESSRGDAAPADGARVEVDRNNGVHAPKSLGVGEGFRPDGDDCCRVGDGVSEAGRVLGTSCRRCESEAEEGGETDYVDAELLGRQH
jgi:hypothetical protein